MMKRVCIELYIEEEEWNECELSEDYIRNKINDVFSEEFEFSIDSYTA